MALYRRTLEAMRRVLKRAGLPGHHGLHSLRHSYSLAFVRQQMGHASISMTVDVNGSWLPVEQPGAVRGLVAEALLGAVDTRWTLKRAAGEARA